MRVEFITHKHFHKTRPNTTIQSIRALLLKETALVVIDREKFVGILSVKDLAKRPFKYVTDCITEKPIIDSASKIENALSLMIEWNIEVLPVFKQKFFLGLVFKDDILEYLKEQNTELEAEVKKRTIELELATQKAQESEELKSAFLANLSHEIRTPLNGIMGFSEMIVLRDLPIEKLKAFAQIIAKGCKQLLQIINEVLIMSKLESGQLDLFNNRIDLQIFLTDIFEFYDILAKEKNIELKFNQSPDFKKNTLFADEIKLRQVFDNLLNNAFKYTNKGFVEFGYHLDSGRINFYVKDSGIGIRKDHHEKIFERFQQVETDYLKDSAGIGLGLAISKALVTIMGGEISVKSEVNVGSEFIFNIPYQAINESDRTE